MELVLFVVFVGGAITLFVHPKTKKHPIILWLKRAWKKLGEMMPSEPEAVPPKPAQPAPTNAEPGNVPRVKAELGKEPPTKGVHVFPEPRDPVTRFEEFNAKLFLYENAETPLWSGSLDNDFGTKISGDFAWLEGEIKKRLRPSFPVLYDPFGLWAAASKELEMDPHFADPIASAYLSLPRDVRPVVISKTGDAPRTNATAKKTPEPKRLKLYRYGFVDYRFDRKFLEDYPADLLTGLLRALSGPEDEWEAFSPARLRGAVLDENREEEAHRQAMASHQHANRFAALWSLREEDSRSEEALDDLSEAEAAQ